MEIHNFRVLLPVDKYVVVWTCIQSINGKMGSGKYIYNIKTLSFKHYKDQHDEIQSKSSLGGQQNFVAVYANKAMCTMCMWCICAFSLASRLIDSFFFPQNL